jgi:protein phosphatase
MALQYITIKAAALNELGGRKNNEDSIFPEQLDAQQTAQKVFVVCDGVGGSEKGEIASSTVADFIGKHAMAQALIDFAHADHVHALVAGSEGALMQHLAKNPETEGMATTLTLLILHDAGATLAHIGDSRIYHIREDSILFKTTDHSLVNELVEDGIITPEQAKDHPQRNVITRALKAGRQGIKADVAIITEVQECDYFFLCTDGVLEQLSETELPQLCRELKDVKAVMAAIKAICTGRTKDNFSAYLVQVEKVSGAVDEAYLGLANAITYQAEIDADTAQPDFQVSVEAAAGPVEPEQSPMPERPQSPPAADTPLQPAQQVPANDPPAKSKAPVAWLAVLFLVLAGAGYWWLKKRPNKEIAAPVADEINEAPVRQQVPASSPGNEAVKPNTSNDFQIISTERKKDTGTQDREHEGDSAKNRKNENLALPLQGTSNNGAREHTAGNQANQGAAGSNANQNSQDNNTQHHGDLNNSNEEDVQP